MAFEPQKRHDKFQNVYLKASGCLKHRCEKADKKNCTHHRCTDSREMDAILAMASNICC